MSSENKGAERQDAAALREYLSWQALSSEFACGIVARGIPLAPTRDTRKALMHQVRTENSQAVWLVARVEELGGAVPEQDDELIALQSSWIELCDRGWLEFLACGQVALRGYTAPYINALGAVFELDETYDMFSRDVLVPEIQAHFRRALSDMEAALGSCPESEKEAALERARLAEEAAYELFTRFIATSYPMLAGLGVDTEGLRDEIAHDREHLWNRLDAALAHPAA